MHKLKLPEDSARASTDSRLAAVSRVLDRLACPECFGSVEWIDDELVCGNCRAVYQTADGIADLRHARHKEEQSFKEWSEHWQAEHQKNIVIRLCSVYRKAIFSWSIGYFVNRFFPPSGLFLEAGSGSSETSIRIDKHNGDRILMAVDVVWPALLHCHPCMSGRVCGDLFKLPFKDGTVDGIWNVGVMEHFTHAEINNILREFYRVLRKGGRIVLLWPGKDSLPQKVLHVAQDTIRIARKQKEFQLHPAEISQLSSIREGQDFLAGAGFRTVFADNGLRSVMACKTLVGEKG